MVVIILGKSLTANRPGLWIALCQTSSRIWLKLFFTSEINK